MITTEEIIKCITKGYYHTYTYTTYFQLDGLYVVHNYENRKVKGCLYLIDSYSAEYWNGANLVSHRLLTDAEISIFILNDN